MPITPKFIVFRYRPKPTGHQFTVSGEGKDCLGTLGDDVLIPVRNTGGNTVKAKRLVAGEILVPRVVRRHVVCVHVRKGARENDTIRDHVLARQPVDKHDTPGILRGVHAGRR